MAPRSINDELETLSTEVERLGKLFDDVTKIAAEDEAGGDDGDAGGEVDAGEVETVDTVEVAKLKAEVDKAAADLTKALDTEFDRIVKRVKDRDNCSGLVALSRARLEAPSAFRAWERNMSANVSKELEQQGGKPAGDRIDGPPVIDARAANIAFDAAVAEIARTRRISKAAACSAARVERSDLYDALQRK
jgi:hypothetical protein